MDEPEHADSVHHQVQLALAPYVLGTASPDERLRVEAHAARCGECGELLAAFEEVALGLAYASVDREPPAALRAGVQEAVAGAAAADRRERAGGSAEGSVPELRSSRRWLGWLPLIVTPVAVLAAVVLALELIDSRSQLEELRDRSGVSTASDGGEGREAYTVVGGTATRSLQFSGIPDRDVSGMLVSDGERGYVVLRDMPQAPPGRVWQAWIVRPGDGSDEVSIDTFDGGAPMFVVPFGRIDDDRTGTFAITSEPHGGSAQPTTAPVAVGGFTFDRA